MFDNFRKKIATKVTNDTVDNVKKTFNERVEEYGDIIEIGLVLAVIIFGGKHLTKSHYEKTHQTNNNYYPPLRLPPGSGQPIVINNYYTREREDQHNYVREEKQNGPRKNYQRR